MSEPMEEVRSNTTPGTDARVEEMARPPMHQHEGSAEHRSMEQQSFEDRREPGGSMDDRREGQPMGGRDAYDRAHEGGARDDMDDPVAHYRTRFAEAQSRFIDNPQSALEEARSVVEEAIDKYMDSLRMDAGAGNGDTEQMRRAMQRYRDLFDRLAGGSRL